MGIFDRIRSSIRGRAEEVVSGLEKSNPEAVYDAAITTTQQHVSDQREHAAALIARRDRQAERLAAMAREAESVLAALMRAVEENDDDTALVLQVRKSELDEQIEALAADLASLDAQAEDAKRAARELKDGAKELKSERDRSLAALAVAQSQIALQEASSGLATTPDARGLDSVRESIDRLQSQAGISEASAARDRALERAADSSARRQLEELKKARKP